MTRHAHTALAMLVLGLFTSATHAQLRERSIGFAVGDYTPRYNPALTQYAGAIATSFTYEYLSEKNSFLRAGVGFHKHSGDAYDRNFVDGPRATQALMPFELSVGYRAPVFGDGGVTIVVGVGAQYLSYWETYPGVQRVAAQGIGAIFYIGPEIAITKRLRVGLEYRALVGDVQVRTPGALRYEVDVGGSFVQLAVRRVL